jgi:DNA polymerase IV
MSRRILHVDLDEFFAAVEKLDNPRLRGLPLLVGGSPEGRGVVSTASYEARKFGCRSAMPMRVAMRLCPQAVVLPVRPQRYKDMSERVFAILDRFTPLIEPLSIDEAFLDVTGSERLCGPAEQIARDIKDAIRQELALTISVGVAPNKFLAKLASEMHKPDGLTIIHACDLPGALDAIAIERMWGVGPTGADKLHALGLSTFGDLRLADAAALTAAVGSWGAELQKLAAGLDDRPVTPDSQAKSISAEQTFAQDVADLDELRRVLLDEVEHVARRLRRHGLSARTITLKLRYGDFTTLTRSATDREPTDVTEQLWKRAQKLFAHWAERCPGALRLLGFGASNFRRRGDGMQMSLFEDPDQTRQRQLDATVDAIAQRFGPAALRRGKVK